MTSQVVAKLPVSRTWIFFPTVLTTVSLLFCFSAQGNQDESVVKILSDTKSGAREYGSQIKTYSLPQSKDNPSSKVEDNKQSQREKKNKIQATAEGVRFELNECTAHPELKSITCNMTLTNLEHDADIVLYCYSGTSAADSAGNSLQCAHAWVANNHNWNFAYEKLAQGTPAKAMVRLEAKDKNGALSELHFNRSQSNTHLLSEINFSFSVNGLRKILTFKKIPVQL